MSKMGNGFARKVGLLALVVVMCAMMAMALAGCGGTQKKTYSEDEMVTVRVGYWGGTCESPMYVAYEQGFFEENGINAEMVRITNGSAAFLAEGGYCCFEATPNFLPMMINGLDVKFLSSIHTGCLQAVAAPDSGIESIADLAGKKVGLFSAGGDPGEVFLKAAMTNAGVDYTQTEWIVEGAIGTILQDLKEGKIDAFAYFDPYGEVAAKYFDCTKFWSNGAGSEYEDTTCCFLAANADIYNDPEIAKRVATAVQQACEWIEADKAGTAALIQEKAYVADSNALLANFGVDTSSADITDIHEDLLNTYTFGDGGQKTFDKSLRDNWEIIEKAGMLPEGKTVDELCEATGLYAL